MPFEKGKSGNPGGRSKERPFREALRKQLNDIDPKDPDQRKKLEHVARKCVDLAMDGNMQAIKEIADRIDGKSDATLNVNGTHEVHHTSEPVSETTAWINGLLSDDTDSETSDTRH
tara:strand:- start:5248 stop:5595 length:348 start_codon:yes stop_codon:yes gene_type:complete